MTFFRLLSAALILLADAAPAHEFWIEPRKYQVETGEMLEADLRNGQEFDGISLSFVNNRFTRFETVAGDTVKAVEGRMGDIPALAMQAPQEGLLVILHETAPSTVTYDTWEKFMSFVSHKDFSAVEATHAAQGWPREGFRESYTRHAKALVAVGDGEGADRIFGMATEFVALTNPYADGFDSPMVVDLYKGGQPRGDAQVEVFDRAPDGSVSVSLHRTDTEGHAEIPLTQGHAYLFDAVVLRPLAPAADSPKAPVWETLWAALTFEVPTGG